MIEEFQTKIQKTIHEISDSVLEVSTGRGTPYKLFQVPIVKELLETIDFTKKIMMHYISRWIYLESEQFFMKEASVHKFQVYLDKIFEK